MNVITSLAKRRHTIFERTKCRQCMSALGEKIKCRHADMQTRCVSVCTCASADVQTVQTRRIFVCTLHNDTKKSYQVQTCRRADNNFILYLSALYIKQLKRGVLSADTYRGASAPSACLHLVKWLEKMESFMSNVKVAIFVDGVSKTVAINRLSDAQANDALKKLMGRPLIREDADLAQMLANRLGRELKWMHMRLEPSAQWQRGRGGE